MKHVFVFIQFLCITILSYFGDALAFDVLILLQLVAIVLSLWAIRSVGDNNWSVYPVPNKGSAISSLGAYLYVRHPMYTALLLFFMAVAIRANGPFSWAIYGILWIMLLTKVLVEEHKITQKHPEYTQYKRVTKKRLIPFVW
jgi:protein-S-isoprenylcysteine O-methyltransferase Ste14